MLDRDKTDKLTNLTLMSDQEKWEMATLEREHVHLIIGGIYHHVTDGEDYQLVEFVEDISQALFKNLKTQRNKIMSVYDFKNVKNKQNTSVYLDINEISDSAWNKAYNRYVAIKPLLGGSFTTLEDRSKEVGVSARSLRRWLNAFSSTGSIASLIERKSGRAKGERRLKPHLEKVIQDVINEHYLTIQRPSAESVIREVHKRCFEIGFDKPSKNTIRRRLDQITERDYLKGRGYRKRAKQQFTPKPGMFPNADYPLAVIQIDHTPADIILVDDKYRKPIGRPYLTLAMDIYSRMVTGYYISLDAPSVTSVGMCLARSILPKTDILLEHDITDATWDVFGLPRKVHVDNGSDFRADSLRKSCMMHGIDVEFRPVARPEFGGHIERILGNIMQKVHELPGTTFSNIKEKDEYDSEKHASMTLAEFEKWVVTYITKVYHETPHSALGRSPNEQWKIGIFGDGYEPGIGIPSLPSDQLTLTLDFMPSVERTIQRDGVRIDGLQYYDACLSPFINDLEDRRNKKKTKFIFRRDPRDISKVWFYDPMVKLYFTVPLANQALPAMSLWEYKALSKQIRETAGKVNEALIYQAWEDMNQIVKEGSSKSKSLRRQEQRHKSHKRSQTLYEPVAAEKVIEEILPSASANSNDDYFDGLGFFEDID